MALGTGRPSSKSGRPQAVPPSRTQSGGQRISNHPEDAETGGGCPDNVDAEIVAIRADTWEYPGRSDLGPVPALLVTFKINGQEQEQTYTAGDLSQVVPSSDGSCFMAAEGSSRKGLNDNCNAMLFIQALIDHSFPNDERLDDFGNLVGLSGHLTATAPRKKREGLEGGNKPIAVFTKIHRMPWEQKGKASASAPRAGHSAGARATTATVASPSDGEPDELTAEAIEVLVQMLGEGPLPLKDEKGKSIGMQVFQAIPKNPNRSAILKKISEKGFFDQEGLPFQVDGDQVVLL